jgi:hypothetical protein
VDKVVAGEVGIGIAGQIDLGYQIVTMRPQPVRFAVRIVVGVASDRLLN